MLKHFIMLLLAIVFSIAFETAPSPMFSSTLCRPRCATVILAQAIWLVG
jgi:hypothetical protein